MVVNYPLLDILWNVSPSELLSKRRSKLLQVGNNSNNSLWSRLFCRVSQFMLSLCKYCILYMYSLVRFLMYLFAYMLTVTR